MIECQLCNYKFKETEIAESKLFKAYRLNNGEGILIFHRAHVDKIKFEELKDLFFFIKGNFGEFVDVEFENNFKGHFSIRIHLPQIKASICVLCGKKIIGSGNNPQPLAKDGVCCDSCNYIKVIPARFGRLQ